MHTHTHTKDGYREARTIKDGFDIVVEGERHFVKLWGGKQVTNQIVSSHHLGTSCIHLLQHSLRAHNLHHHHHQSWHR